MLIRIISSAFVLPVFVYFVLNFHASVRVVMAAILCLAFLEYWRMLEKKGWAFQPFTGLVCLLLLLGPVLAQDLTSAGWPQSLEKLGEGFIIAGFLMAAAIGRVLKPDLKLGLERFFAEAAGPLYLGVLGMFMLKLHALPDGGWWLLLVFWFAWVYDAGAYFTGKFIGKRFFSPLSPKKTWEGFFGGLLVNAVIATAVLPHFLPMTIALDRPALLLISLGASLLAQAGDLLESMIKRSAGVKDSGQLVANHGGFLDKIDSGLFVAPFLY
jgi:phosphatidate cytidylyltransferase